MARRAGAHGAPVIALAGTVGEGVHEVRGCGSEAWTSVVPGPRPPAESLGRGAEFLAEAAEHALRMVLLGTRLRPRPVPGAHPRQPRPAKAPASRSGTQRPSSVR